MTAPLLRGIRAHLNEGGRALVPLAVPEPLPADQLGRARVATADDGSKLSVAVVSQKRDEAARTQLSVLRYERHRGGQSTVEERPWLLHWYTRSEFESLAEEAGLRVEAVTGADGSPAASDAVDADFHLQAV
ncbi:hypothetical protein [Nocardiopsis valliformis]|uniref:hypothetical protein n=1 Tax=Nocardiopsis valliformis TaxID=239974 RepID=UPI00034B1E8D|nr:hypothetical protein [Nocardiopsis valliformis]